MRCCLSAWTTAVITNGRKLSLRPRTPAYSRALAIERGDVGFVDDGEVHRGLDGTVERLGDLAPHAAERNALGDAVTGDRPRAGALDMSGTAGVAGALGAASAVVAASAHRTNI